MKMTSMVYSKLKRRERPFTRRFSLENVWFVCREGISIWKTEVNVMGYASYFLLSFGLQKYLKKE